MSMSDWLSYSPAGTQVGTAGALTAAVFVNFVATSFLSWRRDLRGSKVEFCKATCIQGTCRKAVQ